MIKIVSVICLYSEMVSIVFQCPFCQVSYSFYTHVKFFQPFRRTNKPLIANMRKCLGFLPLSLLYAHPNMQCTTCNTFTLWQCNSIGDMEPAPKQNSTSVIWKLFGFSETNTIQTTALYKNMVFSKIAA